MNNETYKDLKKLKEKHIAIIVDCNNGLANDDSNI